jgi:hypothetical protein
MPIKQLGFKLRYIRNRRLEARNTARTGRSVFKMLCSTATDCFISAARPAFSTELETTESPQCRVTNEHLVTRAPESCCWPKRSIWAECPPETFLRETGGELRFTIVGRVLDRKPGSAFCFEPTCMITNRDHEQALARKLPYSPCHQCDRNQCDQQRAQSVGINRRTASSLHNGTTRARYDRAIYLTSPI